MMPMPPTRSEIEATAASSSAMIRLLPSAALGDLAEIAHRKSLTSPGRMWWRRTSVSRHLSIAVCTSQADGLDVDLVDEAGEARLKIVRIGGGG